MRPCGRRISETSLRANGASASIVASSPGISSTSNSPASARASPAPSSSRSTAARKPIVPKLKPNTGTSVPA